MNVALERTLDARDRSQTGYIAVYLPKERAQADAWLADLRGTLASSVPIPRSPAVDAMATLFKQDPVARMYVEQMIAQQPAEHRVVTSVAGSLAALYHIVTTAPSYTPGPSQGTPFRCRTRLSI